MVHRLHHRPLSLRLQSSNHPKFYYHWRGIQTRNHTLECHCRRCFFFTSHQPGITLFGQFPDVVRGLHRNHSNLPVDANQKDAQVSSPLVHATLHQFFGTSHDTPHHGLLFPHHQFEQYFHKSYRGACSFFSFIRGNYLTRIARIYQFLLILYYHRSYTPVHFQSATIFQSRDKFTGFIPDGNSRHPILPPHHPCHHFFHHEKSSRPYIYLL